MMVPDNCGLTLLLYQHQTLPASSQSRHDGLQLARDDQQERGLQPPGRHDGLHHCRGRHRSDTGQSDLASEQPYSR